MKEGSGTSPQLDFARKACGGSEPDPIFNRLDFGSTQAGTSVDRVVTVRNDGNANLSVNSITSAIPSGFSLVSNLSTTTLQPGQSVTFTLRLNAASVGSFSGDIDFTNSDANEGTYNLHLQGTVTAAPAPEVSVLIGSSGIADGGTIDFGSTQAGTSVDRVVTVRNDGNANLSVNSITSAIPSGFSLVSNLSTTTLQPGQSVTFTLRLNAASVGSFSGDIDFTKSDANEGIYDLHLQGTVTASTTQTSDDGDAGNTPTGTWALGTGGRAGDVHVATKATSDTAVSRWTFENLVAGQYRVYMNWTGNSLNANNAPVTIVAGTQNLGTSYVNQRVASSGYTADGTNWFLARTVTITGSTLRAVLSNNANGYVVADAVRIERVGAAAPVARGAVLSDRTSSGSEGRVSSSPRSRARAGRVAGRSNIQWCAKTWLWRTGRKLCSATTWTSLLSSHYWKRLSASSAKSAGMFARRTPRAAWKNCSALRATGWRLCSAPSRRGRRLVIDLPK